MPADRFYRIAGETVAADGELSLTGWEDFAVPVCGQSPVCRIEGGRAVTLYGVESLSVSHPVAHVLCMGDDILLGDASMAHMTLHRSGDASPRPHERPAGEGLLLAGVSAALSRCGAVLVHGALVDVPSVGGLLFLGASGVGKSTQAALWQREHGGHILNGDRVLLRMDTEAAHPVGYGSPWAGSSGYRVNREAEVVCLVALERGKSADICPLTPEESLRVLTAHTLFPSFHADGTIAATETVMRIATATPTVGLLVPEGSPAVGVARLLAHLGEKGDGCGSL